jgi:hypothetical protein
MVESMLSASLASRSAMMYRSPLRAVIGSITRPGMSEEPGTR